MTLAYHWSHVFSTLFQDDFYNINIVPLSPQSPATEWNSEPWISEKNLRPADNRLSTRHVCHIKLPPFRRVLHEIAPASCQHSPWGKNFSSSFFADCCGFNDFIYIVKLKIILSITFQPYRIWDHFAKRYCDDRSYRHAKW